MLSPKCIMVVDDNPVDCFITKKVITAAGSNSTVIIFQEATEALQYLSDTLASNAADNLPSLILLDINMPVMNGWQFLDEFAKLPGHAVTQCHIFMLSSSNDTRDLEHSRQYMQVDGYLTKPLTLEKFTGLVPRIPQNS
jgi:CheY-like chemotaxis protein